MIAPSEDQPQPATTDVAGAVERSGISRRWITVGNFRYHYRVASPAQPTGPPLILVHGLGVSSAYWRRVQPLLARTRAVYAPDLPGFGGTTRPDTILDSEELARALGDWLSALGLSRVHLLGHSLGGQVAATLAHRRPEMVARLILVGSTIGARGAPSPKQTIGLLRDAARESPSLLPRILRDYLRAGPRRVIGTDRRTDADDTIAAIARLRMPVLVIRGSRDAVVSANETRAILDAAPDARYREIPDAPHALQWSHAQELASIVEAFLDTARSTAPTSPE